MALYDISNLCRVKYQNEKGENSAMTEQKNKHTGRPAKALPTRTIPILTMLSLGPSNKHELKAECFKRVEGIDNKIFTPKLDRSIKFRQNDEYVSHQRVDFKLKTLRTQQLCDCIIYSYINALGMPIHEQIYILSEKGKDLLVSLGLDEENMTYGRMPYAHIGHNLNLARMVRRIYRDNAKYYQIIAAHGERVLRSEIFQKFKSIPKGIHFPDLRLKLDLKSGLQIELAFEMANEKEDRDFWEKKITYLGFEIFIVCKNDNFSQKLTKWIKELKLPRPVYVATLQDFLINGIAGTTWSAISGNDIKKRCINVEQLQEVNMKNNC
jgi:hypothetical protein